MNDSSGNSVLYVSKPTGNSCFEMIPDGDETMDGLYIDLKFNNGNAFFRNLEKETDLHNVNVCGIPFGNGRILCVLPYITLPQITIRHALLYMCLVHPTTSGPVDRTAIWKQKHKPFELRCH